MTNTEIELSLCTDCFVVIANGDDSGVADPEAHAAGMDERWGGEPYRLVVLPDREPFFSHRECGGCGALPGTRFPGMAVPLD